MGQSEGQDSRINRPARRPRGRDNWRSTYRTLAVLGVSLVGVLAFASAASADTPWSVAFNYSHSFDTGLVPYSSFSGDCGSNSTEDLVWHEQWKVSSSQVVEPGLDQGDGPPQLRCQDH